MPSRTLPAALAIFVGTSAFASDLIGASPLTDRAILLHFDDGHVVHHRRGQKRWEESVVTDPLDTTAASRTTSYKVTSGTDPAFNAGIVPALVGRKSKGTDFAWMFGRTENGIVVNDGPDHAKEHWVVLFLPAPMKAGKTYTISTGGLAKNARVHKLVFNPKRTRSETVHANTLGYATAAPVKFAYLYYWSGDRGGLDLSAYAGKPFRLIEQSTGKPVFGGKVAFRKGATNPETGQPNDTPNANFLGADVYECDFSGFSTPGTYVVSVDGLGTSWPFEIAADLYRKPFVTVARALYHNRSGIALTKPYTEFERPAPHNPKLTPGFAGKLVYSSLRSLDYGSESGTKAQIEPTIKGPIGSCGWYQDAGDWDSYESHLRVAQELLLAYELNPKAHADGDLNIPESGNGLPDLLDEAAWLPRFCHALRQELLAKRYATGGIGLRVAGDAFGEDAPEGTGRGSWEDVDRLYVVSGEDPVSTYRYAGTAAGLAHCLTLAGKKDPKGVDWAREARESYAWAARNTLAKDEPLVKNNRLYAAAALFRLTGEKSYEDLVRQDTTDLGQYSELWFENLYGPAQYALSGSHDAKRDPELLARIRAALLNTAEKAHESATKRALRWGGNWGFPMLVGQQTTPWVMDLAVGRELVRDDPAKHRAWTADLYTSCDYVLGTNSENKTWFTGLGPRSPKHPFHMDAWYNGKSNPDGSWLPHPGLSVYSPWRIEMEQGNNPTHHDWGNQTAYPAAREWPGNELYWDNRCSPMGGEFTIHQNTAPAAAIFAVLCAPR